MNSTALAAACVDTGQASALTHTTNPQPTAVAVDRAASPVPHVPRGNAGGGSFLPAADVLASPTSPEYGAPVEGLQLDILGDVRMVSDDELRSLAIRTVNRVARHDYDYHWGDFRSGCSMDLLSAKVREDAIRQANLAGLKCGRANVPALAVHHVVTRVLEDMDGDPDFRPSREGLGKHSKATGDKGRATQQQTAQERRQILRALLDAGVTDKADLARRLNIDVRTVYRYLSQIRQEDAASDADVTPEALEKPFPAPDIPPSQRWPVVRFLKTGGDLTADEARDMAAQGQCYEAEGREGELMRQIRASADAEIDRWAYLQRCMVNRGDAWTVPAHLLADVLGWAGEDPLKYALLYADRLLPYLRRTLATAIAEGKRPARGRRVRRAIDIARQWAKDPDLVITHISEAFAAEDAAIESERSRFVDSYRRRFGRLPWEEPEPKAVEPAEFSDIRIGVRGDDLINPELVNQEFLKSSPPPDAHVTPSRSAPTSSPPERTLKLEQPPNPAVSPDSDEIRRPQRSVEALKSAESTWTPLASAILPPVLEHGPCRHPLAALMSTTMSLDVVVQVDCSHTGCGCRIYSDRGPLECPCHLSSAQARALAKALH